MTRWIGVSCVVAVLPHSNRNRQAVDGLPFTMAPRRAPHLLLVPSASWEEASPHSSTAC